jgi:N-acetylglucosamine-6-sulfatase
MAGAVGALGLGACAQPAQPGGLPVAVPVTNPDGDHPNLVVVVSDDHRWDHVSYHPDHPPFLNTPNLDRLASQAVVGTNAFVTTALCSPSRGTFLSGQYASRHGVQNNLTAWNPQTETFFEPLMAAGYDCAFIGKWHMPGQLPNLRGVDTFVTFTAEQGQGQYVDCPLLIDGVMTERPGTYITDDLTDLALEWIASRPAGKPYALWLAHKAVHHQFIPPARFAGALADADLSNLPPESFAFQSLMDENIWEGTLGDLRALYRRYCETLLGLDDQVGRLVDSVDLEDTYVVYTSDNGYSWGEHVLTGKRWAYEENTRVPFLAAGPGLRPGTTDAMILNADLAPTLLDWAGVDPLPQAQGQSVAAVLAGDRSGVREEFIYEYFPDYPYHVPGMQAVRDDRWLYVEYDTGPAPQLFDVVADPRTQEDLAQRDPAKVAQMAARLGRLRERVEAGEVV